MPHRISPEKRETIAASWPAILQAIRDGERIDLTAAKFGVQRDDLWAFRAGNPALVAEWYDAMKDSADSFIDKAMDAAANAGKDAKAARVQLAAYQWIAEKRDPDRYGQRTRADINVKSVDLTQIIQDANARLAASKHGQLIDHATQKPVTDNNAGADRIRAHAQDAIEHATLHAAGLL